MVSEAAAEEVEPDASTCEVDTALEGATGWSEQPIAAPNRTQQRTGDRVRIVIVFLLVLFAAGGGRGSADVSASVGIAIRLMNSPCNH
jgi:hypothetical protein